MPQNFQADDRYRKLSAIARHAAEKAKIALSSTDSAVIFAGDEQIRVADADGDDIYLSIDITRNDLEGLIAESLDKSIVLCRKILKDNGYSHDDIDRIVLIGGPSKMPCVRMRVPQELGVSGRSPNRLDDRRGDWGPLSLPKAANGQKEQLGGSLPGPRPR